MGTSPAGAAAAPAVALPDSRSARAGVLAGLAAYGAWGLFPIYFKAVAHVPPFEVLAHRVLWAMPFTLALCWAMDRWRTLGAALGNPAARRTLAVTCMVIAVNWFVYVWAIVNSRIMQASLGYYINPLVNVLLGVVFLGERLRGVQRVCVGLAAVGVGYITWHAGQPPVIPLVLALSFGTYGLLRKRAPVDALVGLCVECLFLYPLAVAYLGALLAQGRGSLVFGGMQTSMLLVFAGPLTSVPLIWFAAAARRLRLATLGFLQYVAPSLQLACAVFLYGEKFTHAHAVAFGFIWVALALYSWDAVSHSRAPRPD